MITIKLFFSKNKHDSAKIWDKVNSLMGKNSNNNIDDNIKTAFANEDTRTLCNKFVKNFTSQVAKLKKIGTRKTLRHTVNTATLQNTFSVLTPTEYEIRDIFSNVVIKKSTGHDGFCMEHFVHSKENSSKLMVKLISNIIETEIWPDSLKKQIIRPIFKKGNRTEIKNYRPVALLPVLNKIVEKFFAIRIEKFLKQFGLLNVNQFGYQKGKGTADALNHINNHITRALNEGKYAAAIMIDLQKAFDTLDKDILKEKLSLYGIRGKMLNIITSYLTNRLCSVKIDNKLSEWTNIEYGVPQGSILGPLLFLIYLNDLKEINWNTYITLYADDIFMLSIHNDKEIMISNLQKDFSFINNYFTHNELYISDEKTCVMPISTSHMNLEKIVISLHDPDCNKNSNMENCNCKKLNQVTHAKYLGLEIDKNWKFYEHIENLITKVRRLIPILYKIKDKLNNCNKRLLYETCILSNVRYACMVYASTSFGIINRLQKILNKAAKVLFGDYTDMKSTKDIFNENKLMTLHNLFNYTIITNNYFSSEWKIPVNRSVRNNNNWLILPSVRNSYGKRGMNYIVPNLFNKIPAKIRKLNNLYKMKKEIKEWLLNHNTAN